MRILPGREHLHPDDLLRCFLTFPLNWRVAHSCVARPFFVRTSIAADFYEAAIGVAIGNLELEAMTTGLGNFLCDPSVPITNRRELERAKEELAKFEEYRELGIKVNPQIVRLTKKIKAFRSNFVKERARARRGG